MLHACFEGSLTPDVPLMVVMQGASVVCGVEAWCEVVLHNSCLTWLVKNIQGNLANGKD